MITTRESLEFQFSLIYVYASTKNEDVIVGDVIGPGKLTRQKVKELSFDVIKFLRMYNAIIRDYCGSEVFSVEFELYNLTKLNVPFPKSMILIPGRYKDCESLLLALKPETGYMNMHKSRSSVDKISTLFFEVEEFTEHPDLNLSEKELFLSKFASRFATKLYGDLLENKWNKKLIGLNESLPTENEMLNKFIDVTSKYEIQWTERPPKIILKDHQYRNIPAPFEGKREIEHLKYRISEPSANFIVEKTLQLAMDLFNLANTGTIDETKEQLVLFIETELKSKLKPLKGYFNGNEFIRKINDLLKFMESYFRNFLNFSRDFLTTGEMGDISTLLEIYKTYICEKGITCNEEYKDLCDIAINYFSQSIIQKENLRAIDLSSGVNYFSELIKNSLTLIQKALPKYLARKKIAELMHVFITNLKKELDKEQKPARILGYKFIENYQNFLNNIIEIHPSLTTTFTFYDDKTLNDTFYEILNDHLDEFFDSFALNISDIISFAEEEMEKDSDAIKEHIHKFKRFNAEIPFLLSYILRFSTMNRFLKSHSNEDLIYAEPFFHNFTRFLEKRMGGINLVWNKYMLEWIDDFIEKKLKEENEIKSSFKENYEQFINYLELREAYELKVENFLDFLNIYIAKIEDPVQKPQLLDFFKQYEFCLDIKEEFPNYLKSKIKREIEAFNLNSEPNPPLSFFSIENGDSFMTYLRETELKYFSKLIPRPKIIILKHNLTTDEKEVFNGDLFHVFNFKFLKKVVELEVGNNFKKVFREWEI